MKRINNLLITILVLNMCSNVLYALDESKDFALGCNVIGGTDYTDNYSLFNVKANIRFGYFLSPRSELGIGLDFDLLRQNTELTLTNDLVFDVNFNYSHHFENKLIFEVFTGIGRKSYSRKTDHNDLDFHYRFKVGIGIAYQMFLSDHLALIPGLYFSELIENYKKYPDFQYNLLSNEIFIKAGIYYYFNLNH